MTKILKASLLLGTFISGGILWLYQSSKPHYDHLVEINGRRLIDIALTLPGDTAEIKKQVTFYVPIEYSPRIGEGQVGLRLPTFFGVYFRYPSKVSYPNAESIVPQADMVHLFVNRHASRKTMRSELMAKKNGEGSFNKLFDDSLVYFGADNHPVLIRGNWTNHYDVTRSYNDQIELSYIVDKQLHADLNKIDQAAIELVNSFQLNQHELPIAATTTRP